MKTHQEKIYKQEKFLKQYFSKQYFTFIRKQLQIRSRKKTQNDFQSSVTRKAQLEKIPETIKNKIMKFCQSKVVRLR